MRLISCSLPPDHKIYWLGDTHEGYSAQYTQGLVETIDEIARNDDAYWVHMGDICETLTPDNPFYDPIVLKKDPEYKDAPSVPYVQAMQAAKMFAPIQHKCLFVLQGNHERRARRWGDLAYIFAKEMKIPHLYGGYTCKLSVHDNRKSNRLMYKTFQFHGRSIPQTRAGSERQRRANREASLQRVLAPLAGDCVIMAMGHTHHLLVSSPIDNRLYLVDQNGKISQRYIKWASTATYIEPDNRYYLNTGSFVRTQVLGMDTYSEICGYPPVELGYPVSHVESGVITGVKEIPRV